MIIRRNKKNKKPKNRKKESWRSIVRKMVFWVLFLSFWGVAAWTLFFSDVMKVRQVIYAGADEDLSGFDVENHVRQFISGKFFDVVPKDNLLLISRKSIADDLREKNKLIRDVSVAKKFPSGIVISVEKRASHIIWCNEQTCVLVDERGEAFCETENFDQNRHVKILDVSNKPFTLDDRVASPEFVLFSEQLPFVFRDDLHMEIEPVLRTPSSMSEEVRVATSAGWEVFFSTTRPLEVQLRVLEEVLREKIQPDRRDRLEYIDLRIKGKVTYKFKQDEEKNDEHNGEE